MRMENARGRGGPGADNRTLLRDILRQCAALHCGVWIFGGWAEELWGLTSPRPHKDIDLLYPAPDFSRLDADIQATPEWEEILLKRFPHKRAIKVHGTMVEFFLIQDENGNTFTNFFEKFRFHWPRDTFDYTTSLFDIAVHIASKSALRQYRERHDTVVTAYRQYIASQEGQPVNP